jgi:hypothetical protein
MLSPRLFTACNFSITVLNEVKIEDHEELTTDFSNPIIKLIEIIFNKKQLLYQKN